MAEVGAKKEARGKKMEKKKQTEEHCAKCGVKIVPDPNREEH